MYYAYLVHQLLPNLMMLSFVVNYGSKDGGDENGRVEKGARKFIGEEGEERRLYVVFTIGIKLEDKKMKLEKWQGPHGKLLTSWR